MTPAIIEAAIARVSAIEDAAARAAAREALSAVLALHAEALRRLCSRLHEVSSDAEPILHAMAEDEVVSSLLLLHDLHPVPAHARVRRAVEDVRAKIEQEGQEGNVIELVSVDANRARVRVTGDESLRRAVVRAIQEAAPDVSRVEVFEPPRAATSMERLVARPALVLVRRTPRPDRPTRESRRENSYRAPSHTHCESCGSPLPKDHEHILDLKVRRLACSCAACAQVERRS